MFSSWSQLSHLYGSSGIFCLTVPCFDYYVRQSMLHLSMAKHHSCITLSQSTVQILMLWTMMGGARCTGTWLLTRLYFQNACFPLFRYQCHLKNAVYSLIWFCIFCSNCVSITVNDSFRICLCTAVHVYDMVLCTQLYDWRTVTTVLKSQLIYCLPDFSVETSIHWILLSTFPCLA